MFSIKSAVILLLAASFRLAGQSSEGFGTLWHLFNQKEYFKMNSAYRQLSGTLREGENLMTGGLLDGVFNKPTESNRKLDSVLKFYASGLNDSMKMEIFDAMLQNYVNLFDYNNASAVADMVLKDYRYMIDSSDTDDFENAAIIWEAGKDLKPQTCIKSGDSKIEASKDLADLYNVKLKINGIASEFIFDTGANFSTITASLAKEMKLKFLKGKLKVGTATDLKVEARLAYAETIEIGKIKYEYVLFLVLPDEVLTFAGGLYKINGIIGFPVIKEMKEITMKADVFFVPQTAVKKETMNMCLHSFTPVINVTSGSDSLIFTFDTGARKTNLYSRYYNKFKGYIDSNYEAVELTTEGAGGEQKIKGFNLNKVTLSAAGITHRFGEIKLFAENFKDKDKDFYGNMGRDFFSESGAVTLNFEYMYIEAVKK